MFRLQRLKNELAQALETERLNEETGISETMDGESTAALVVTVKQAKNLPSCTYFTGTVNPYAKASLIPGSVCGIKSKRTSTVQKTSNPQWNETLTFQPILSRDAELRIELFHAGTVSDALIGDIQIPFATLLHQNLVEDWYPVSNSKSKEASLLVHVQFQYSKVQLLRAEIAALRAQLQEKSMGAFVELDLTCETELEEKDDSEIILSSRMRQRKWWLLLVDWLLPEKPPSKVKRTKTKRDTSKGLSTWLIPDNSEVATKQIGSRSMALPLSPTRSTVQSPHSQTA